MPHIYDHIFETYRIIGAEDDSSLINLPIKPNGWIGRAVCSNATTLC